MAFTVTFYKITDNPKKIDKTLGNVLHTASCSPWKPVDDLNGDIMIDYSANAEKANYASVSNGIGERTLYCFVREFTKDIGGHCVVHLEIDPLKTNAGQLKECDCICETTCNTEQTYSNRYITNPNLKVTQFTIHGNVKKETENLLSMDTNFYVVGIYGSATE